MGDEREGRTTVHRQTAPGPLAGLRVVEIGQYIAAPFAATIFADQGADVVKIERPGGDPYRRDPARFAAWNRGKPSVVLDLASAAGRAEADVLIDGADVVIENLRPGALGRLGLALDERRRRHPGLVTCSISAYGSSGPARDDPGWEPLVHARAGGQQGLFTAARPIWLPFPMASVAAALLAVLGTGAALVRRETTGYGQHVETSLFEALLFLNAGPIFHRDRHRTGVGREAHTPVLHTYPTSDGRGMQINLSGTERWRELCRLVGIDPDGESGLDFSDPASLAKLADRAWSDGVLDDLARRFAERTADEWERALISAPAAVSKCNTLEEWLAHEQADANELFATVDDAEHGPVRLVGPPIRLVADAGARTSSRRRGSGAGALGGLRVIDMSSFWAGPLAARLLGELGAEVVKIEPPGGEGAYQLMPVLPNIYVDGNRSKRGLTLDLRNDEDRRRLLDLVGAADVVVENAIAGTWEKSGLGEDDIRAVNPGLVYARAKGFGLSGPLASAPVVRLRGAGRHRYGDDPGWRAAPAHELHCERLLHRDPSRGRRGAGVARRARGVAVTSVESSLMVSATVFQSEHVAQIALDGRRSDEVGPELRGPAPGYRLYEAQDGWVVICATNPEQMTGIRVALGVDEVSAAAIAPAVRTMSAAAACSLLRSHAVPATVSVHPCAVPDDEQVKGRQLLATVGHPVAGRFVQVGIPLWLSVDVPAVKGSAPTPMRGRPKARRVKIDTGIGTNLATVPARTGAAEDAGLDCAWAAETVNDPFLSLALAAEHTGQISIGTAVAIAFSRNPMSLAYTANQLQEFSGGRLILGLGSQVRAHIERRFSGEWSRPAARMREFVLALRRDLVIVERRVPARLRRRLLHTYVDDAGIRAATARVRRPARLLAAVGQRMTEVAGEVADGVITHGVSSPRYLREVTLPALQRGLDRVGPHAAPTWR